MTTLMFIVLFVPSFFLHGKQIENYQISVAGTSTLHDWTMELTTAKFNVEGSSKIDSITMSALVKDLKSDSDTMNEKAWQAFQVKQFPKITFETSEFTYNKNGRLTSIKGLLTMKGISKTVHLKDLRISTAGNATTIEGTTPINMKDFGMTPPSIMFMTTGDIVTVTYKISYRY